MASSEPPSSSGPSAPAAASPDERTARALARRVLDRVAQKDAWATLTLDGELVRSGLPERDRRLAAELVYGVLRHRLRLDRALGTHADLKRTPPKLITVLRVAAYQLFFLDRVPAYAAVDDAVDAARSAFGAKLAGFTNAVLRKLVAGEPPPPREPRARLEVTASLPGWILDELAAALPEASELEAAALSLAEQAPLFLRTNLRRLSREALIARLAEEGAAAVPVASYQPEPSSAATTTSPEVATASPEVATASPEVAAASPEVATASPEAAAPSDVAAAPPAVEASAPAASAAAVSASKLGEPSQSQSFREGLFTVQDLSAQGVAEAALPWLEAQRAAAAAAGGSAPPLRILDACAGVGGKSTHLAELTGDREIIDAVDLSATKLGLLRDSARRLGHTSIRTHVCDLLSPSLLAVGRDYPLIILDAPCSGLGVLRRHPDAKWRLVPADLVAVATLQRKLLDAVHAVLAPGGTLIYSVCTFTAREGREQVRGFLERHPDMTLSEEHQLWPHKSGGDGFYLARLLRA